MSFLRSLVERRGSLENPSIPLTAHNITQMFGWGSETESGVSVSPESSLRMIAVYRAIALLSGTVAALPLHVYQTGTKIRETYRPLEAPNDADTDFDLLEYLVAHLLAYGNAYWIKERDGSGKVARLLPLHADRVRPKLIDGRHDRRLYEVTLNDGSKAGAEPSEVEHFRLMSLDGLVGLSPIGQARQAIGVAQAAEKYAARLFSKGSLTRGYLKSDSSIDEPMASRLKTRWRDLHSGIDGDAIAVLGNGLSFERVEIPPDDAQFLETRDYGVSDIAMLFGLPPHLLGQTSKVTSWGTGIESMSIGMVVYTLTALLARIERRISRNILPPNKYCEFKVQGLMRGDSKARGEFYAKGRQWGWFTANDILRLEGQTEIAGGDTYLIPRNMTVWDPSAPMIEQEPLE